MGEIYLCNVRMSHGLYVPGILPNHFSRFCQAFNIGTICEITLNTCSIFQKYFPVVSQLVKESYEISLQIACYEERHEGINIVTDERHGTRKNTNTHT